VAQLNLPKLRAKGNRFLQTMEAAAEEWKQFLLNQGSLDRFGHVHLFVFDIAENPPPLAKGFNVYCARALDGTFFNDDQNCYLYAKFTRFLCIAILTPYDEGNWIRTKIVNGSSLFQIPQTIRDTFVGNFILYRANTIVRIMESQMSARQRGISETYIYRNADRIANSDFARAAFADYEGQQAFISSLPKIGRNEKCPCGSGEKFKNCHGK
jgi:SEC-C motif